jgi:hypothetical protein
MATQTIQDLINSGVFEANQNNPVLIDGTYYQPIYGYGGSGMDAQQGALENVITYKADENQVGGNVNWYDPTGQYQQTTQQQEVAGSFIEGLGEALTDPVVMAAILAAYSGGLLGGTTPAIGNGAFLGEGVASGIPAFDAAYTAAGGVFNPAFGLPIGNGAFLGEGVPTGIPASDAAFLNAGGTFDPAFALGADGLVGTPLVTPTTVTPPVVTPPVVTPPVVPPVVTPPVVPPVVTPPTVTPPIIPPALTEVIKTIAPIAVPAIIASAVSPKTTTPTGFDIVPIPTDWKTPNKPTVAPYTPLTPIDFGTQNLLRGTQFERFLDPNYGQVPEPVQYSQPSNLSYNDLMSILGSRQGMPSASSLSINDIISGIQNQYGQAPTRTMG